MPVRGESHVYMFSVLIVLQIGFYKTTELVPILIEVFGTKIPASERIKTDEIITLLASYS